VRPQWITFLAFVVFTSNILCAIIDGVWVVNADMNLLNYLTGYNSWMSGIIPVVAPAIGFLTHGLPKLIFWDFSFLEGGLSILRWILMAISVGTIFGIVQELRGSK